MSESIFTKIIKGEVPSYKIYEDELTYAFLDIHPVQPGHVLVIPKEEIEFVWDLPDDLYQAVMAASKKVALHMRELLPETHVHMRIVGTDVPHSHVHLIHFSNVAQLKYEPDDSVDPDHEALADMAEMLAIR